MPEITKYLTKDGLTYYNGKIKAYADGKASDAQSAAISASAITLNGNATVTTGYAKTYEISQNGVLIGKIDIPKDLFVQSGKVVTVSSGTDSDNDTVELADGTYIKIVLQNQDDPIYINATSLVDVYTPEANATQVQLAINNGVISATIVAGSISTTELANGAVTADKLGADAVTTVKIADANVTTDKLASSAVTTTKIADDAVTADKIADGVVGTTQLASGVVTSLGKADTAVQSVTASDPTTGTDGTITVDGSEVAVKGLGSAAYTAASAYEVAGAAAALASGQVATNTSDIADLDDRVEALEGVTLEEISNAEIDAMFTTPAQGE